MLIGCHRQPACLKPSGSKRTDSGIAYYRLYRQNLTYLYLRGFCRQSVLRLQERIQREIGEFSIFSLTRFSIYFRDRSSFKFWLRISVDLFDV